MVQKGMSEMINSVWRIKWWRYRYILIAVLLVNVFIVNHFFFDRSLTDLNPFPSGDAGTEVEGQSGKPKTPAELGKSAHDHGKPLDAGTHTHTEAEVVPSQKTPGTFSLDDYDFNGEYVGWPLKRVCKETEFTPGLVYICDNNSGGIGNIRNFILTCIRYAIDAGASGIIMPRIQRRSTEELGVLFTASYQPFSYFFDEKHFRAAMGENCPQITLYNKVQDIPNSKNRNEAVEFYPKELITGGTTGDGCDERGVNRHLDQFRESHDRWLNKLHRYPNTTVPLTVRFRWATFFEWGIYRDGPEFANTFGDILRIRSDIEELAAITIDMIVKFVHEEDKPVETKSEKSKRKALDGPYLGVHLRTEGDALGFWPNFETQSTGYIKEGKEHGLKHAYIATGNATEGHKFRDLALEQLGMKVAGKTDLLKGNDLKRLNKLSWDQQALVDFLVLTKSTHFTGCSFSSFAMNIAFKRHTMTDGIYSRPWKSPGDEFSTLVGRFENWFGDWMFMYDCMWP